MVSTCRGTTLKEACLAPNVACLPFCGQYRKRCHRSLPDLGVPERSSERRCLARVWAMFWTAMELACQGPPQPFPWLENTQLFAQPYRVNFFVVMAILWQCTGMRGGYGVGI